MIRYITFFFLMIRQPPRSTLTDTRFPYTTLFRSVGVDQKAGTAGPDAPQFLIHHGVEEIIEPQPAIFLGNGAAEHARRAGFQPQLARDDPFFFPLVMIRHDFAFDELADAFAPHFMLFAEN